MVGLTDNQSIRRTRRPHRIAFGAVTPLRSFALRSLFLAEARGPLGALHQISETYDAASVEEPYLLVPSTTLSGCQASSRARWIGGESCSQATYCKGGTIADREVAGFDESISKSREEQCRSFPHTSSSGRGPLKVDNPISPPPSHRGWVSIEKLKSQAVGWARCSSLLHE